MFRGSYVALITPMTETGEVDYASLHTLVDYQLQNGTDGLVIMGTTGEAATIPFSEQLAVLQAVIEQVAGRCQILAGNGSNSTAEAIAKTVALNAYAIDGFLTVTPYYNKPTQKGMLAHFQAVAAATDKPVLLYNVPGRTGVDLQAATVAELSQVKNIVGIKEATGSMLRLAELKASCSADFDLLSGDDASAKEFILQGGHGVISVTTNVAPAGMTAMIAAARQGNRQQASDIDDCLQALHRDLFIESNPIPTKWALKRMGLIASDFARLPLTRLEPIHQAVIEQALQQAKINL
ncbi:4-hydroxy-tetrahydrodipicolinate synthase [Rheinheimera sp. 4Y26]|uniref:4-hydroxy-tetrahydrodipicolinate synthase n=1 Tax=Rheinheimera sp. 4Y26 TaxID=2977811 RepID=UPI0021B14636|nr:4-hydroxy-tetrahydrodipicolinate synthase [Rheinheimera sp. 4Y26]MCT6699609.1 4-hydroxy-tetrahydrodipicolinate synthase [Rheinheimera sp. 4Y26]